MCFIKLENWRWYTFVFILITLTVTSAWIIQVDLWHRLNKAPDYSTCHLGPETCNVCVTPGVGLSLRSAILSPADRSAVADTCPLKTAPCQKSAQGLWPVMVLLLPAYSSVVSALFWWRADRCSTLNHRRFVLFPHYKKFKLFFLQK